MHGWRALGVSSYGALESSTALRICGRLSHKAGLSGDVIAKQELMSQKGLEGNGA